MTPLTITNTILFIAGAVLVVVNYEQENYRASACSAFFCGVLVTALLDTFLNCA